jgi:predicted metal-dependent peptidase
MSLDPVPGLAAGRLWAASSFPYLASAVFGAQVTAAPGTGTVSVDESWRLRADPDTVAGWTPQQLGSVLVHHVCHLLRTHADRARAAGVHPDEAATWVRAADAEINDDLVPAGLDLPGDCVMPGDLGAEPGRLAEQYFEAIRQSRLDPEGLDADPGSGGGQPSPSDRQPGSSDRQPGSGDGQPGSGDGKGGHEARDCGSGADGLAREGQGDGPPGLAGWQAELLRRLVAEEITRHGQQAGNVPAGLLRWARDVLNPKIDWRKLLAAELRRAVADTAGAVDYSYRRPSRRASAVGNVVLPALRRPVPEVAVVCDTSGSMTDELLAMALAEVEGLLRSLGLARQVRVLACDTAVAPAQRVSSARQVELAGGGGTNMGAGIEAAAGLHPRPAVTVVLTDGYTPWPQGPPRGMRVVIGLLGDDAPEPPGWARAVHITQA